VPDTLVLCYHAVSPDWAADLSVTPDAFAAQVDHLKRRGYRGVTFTEAVAARARHRRVAVTFDDAFASVQTLARPVLEALDWPATIFAVTRFAQTGEPLAWPGIDQWPGTPHESELASLDWDALKALQDAGWEVGSHTVTHPHLTTLDDARLDEELRRSRAAVRDALGTGCPSIAYPYGDVDARVVEAARRAGYRTGAVLPDHWHAARELEHPRAGIYHPDDLRRFRLKTAPAVRAARRALKR
jgi:peptidoglycan/xylan/chitin deacetylase (PgdA/CDA1 family)